ncbi:toxin-antitoxin system YwqK family antitoxin [Verminephrobacter aporrectodeae]|uniref:hypothetical protein n=1 Tax=Verminephrobacter aporrectodeae TaxID=1110389 RepID=UPI00224402F6|nr:hypothetical protein [Verminephrobacter aporrectodeae]
MKIAMCILVSMMLVATTVADSKSDYELLVGKNIQCPDGFHLVYEPWGENSLGALCLLEHGPQAIAEDGHIRMEGQNAMGKAVGEWRWFTNAGGIYETEQFVDCMKP